MIIIGIICIVLGWLLGLGVLETFGVILLILGIIFNFVPIRGERRRYW